jgi:hypothetical protein
MHPQWLLFQAEEIRRSCEVLRRQSRQSTNEQRSDQNWSQKAVAGDRAKGRIQDKTRAKAHLQQSASKHQSENI